MAPFRGCSRRRGDRIRRRAMPRRARPRWRHSQKAGGGSSAVEADERGGSNQHPALLEREDWTLVAWYRALTHLAREARMTVTIGRPELPAALGSAAAWPLAARAQQGERVRRIGVLTALDGGRSRKSGTYRNPASLAPIPRPGLSRVGPSRVRAINGS